MYKRKQQCLGPLYIIALIKATPICTPVSTETVGQCISDLKYVLYNSMYKHFVAKVRLKNLLSNLQKT